MSKKSKNYTLSGQKLIYMASTGNSTGVHLHFQLEIYGAIKNPELAIYLGPMCINYNDLTMKITGNVLEDALLGKISIDYDVNFESNDFKYKISYFNNWEAKELANCAILPWEGNQHCNKIKYQNYSIQILALENPTNVPDYSADIPDYMFNNGRKIYSGQTLILRPNNIYAAEGNPFIN